MLPADDPSIDYKLVVQRGYDSCASEYEAARRHEAEPSLDALLSCLPDESTVLDIGCGAGVPVARALAARCRVTGVDLSATMIARARANVPSATFIHQDIMTLDLSEDAFDAVVSFYAIFHLPRDEHRELVERIHRWLKPGGHLLATLARHNEAPYTEPFFGVTMYWSNYGLDDYLVMLKDAGFRVVRVATVGHGFDEALEAAPESHPLVWAIRPE